MKRRLRCEVASIFKMSLERFGTDCGGYSDRCGEPSVLYRSSGTGHWRSIWCRNRSQIYCGRMVSYFYPFVDIPLFIVAIKQKGFEFAKKSLYSAIWLSVCLSIFEHLPNWFSFENDLLLTTVCGAACLGVGTGLVFRAGATTGGTDTLASIIKFKYPHMAVSRILQIIDTVIIVSGLMVFGLEKTVYAMILVYISSKTINSVLEGMYFAQAAFILSDKYEAISQAIFEGMGRGNTGIHAQGMYTKKETKMLFVVVSQKQVPELRQLVYRIDPKAFMVVSDVREALGEGFVEDYESVLI